MKYEDLKMKKPIQVNNYKEQSDFVIDKIKFISNEKKKKGKKKNIINTNLKMRLPLENINKLAAPLIEAWCFETFSEIKDNFDNDFSLINVEAQERLGISDIILQFKKSSSDVISANIDVKATSIDIKKSGKTPNITSFSRIRTAYVLDPDYIFIILSIKHKVYTEKDKNTLILNNIMELVDFNVYDLKYISENDISYNPSLGTGQIQIKDIHYVELEYRTTWEMCQLLDKKYLNSRRKTIEDFYREAVKNKWIKE